MVGKCFALKQILAKSVLKGQLKDYSKSAIGQVVISFEKDRLRNL